MAKSKQDTLTDATLDTLAADTSGLADTAKAETIKAEDAAPGKPAETKDWDKERQRADQAEANYRKAIEDKSALTQDVESLSAELSGLQDQLKQLQTAKTDQPTRKKLDPYTANAGDIIEELNAVREELAATRKGLAEQQQYISSLDKQHQQAQVEQVKKELIAEILEPLDKEFGAKYRNAAQDLVNKWINEGKEEAPDGATQEIRTLRASRLLHKAYNEIYDKDQKRIEDDQKKSTTVKTDSGEAGVGFDQESFKPAKTRAEVLAELKRRTG